MSARFPSRWLFAAALLAAAGLASAAAANPPELPIDPKGKGVPQTAPAPAKAPPRLLAEPQLLEEEHVSEHGDMPRVAPVAPEPAPRVLRGCGLPESGASSSEVTKRCLLFTVNPLAAFLPLQPWVPAPGIVLPTPSYLEHPPQYIPPSTTFPLTRELATREAVAAKQTAEPLGMPVEVELIGVMPVEVEEIGVMPAEEESEPQYELLVPAHDPRFVTMPRCPLTEIKVGVQEPQTGSLLFGVGVELSRTGTINVTTEPLSMPKAEPIPAMPRSAQRVFGTSPVPTPADLAQHKRYLVGLPDQEFTFEVIEGHTRVLHLKEAPFRIQIGDTRVFDYTILTPPTEYLLQGLSVGSTTMFLWFGDRNDPANQTILAFQVNVLPEPRPKPRLEEVYRAIQEEINRAFPDSYVHLTLVGDKLVLSGEAKDSIEANRILQTLGRDNAQATAENSFVIVNLIDGPRPIGHIPGIPEGQVRPDLPNRILPGESNFINLLRIPAAVDRCRVGDNVTRHVKEARALLRQAEEARCESTHSAESAQVQLSVLIAEVDGKAARKLNLDRAADGKAPRWVIEVADGARQEALQAGLERLREKGRAKLLAVPRLTTLSGQSASFLAGGEQAVPVPAGLGQVGVQFEEFGTRVNFLPVIIGDGKVRLEVEPEISELCETANVTVEGTIVPGRSSQRVHTTAEIPSGHTLIISGPKAGGNSRLVLLVTPVIVEPRPAATGAAPSPPRHWIGAIGNAFRHPLSSLGFGVKFQPPPPVKRTMALMNQSEDLRKIEAEMENFWLVDQPSHRTPEHVSAGAREETVADLLSKCQRELLRGHYAAAEDLAQEAITRDREQVAADPLVYKFNLLEQVKQIAVLPLGTVPPCDPKAEGRCQVPPGEAKAIGSKERMVEALMQEFNTAFNEGKYRDAEALAERARELDPENAAVAAALTVSRTQSRIRFTLNVPNPAPVPSPVRLLATGGTNGVGAADETLKQAAEAMARFQADYKAGRYEEAKFDALQALAVAPGHPVAVAALAQACEALARRPHPEAPPQCTYVGTGLRPALRPVDPAVVSALQKLLIDGDKTGPVGGVEEAEPKEESVKPPKRR